MIKKFRFQLNNSTEHAILQLVNGISSFCEGGEYTLGIFVDLLKSFDSVEHEIFVSKLGHCEVK